MRQQRLSQWAATRPEPANDSTSRIGLTADDSKGGTGRMSKSGVHTRIHITTQPCQYGPCPHDRDTDTCEAREHCRESQYPSSRSPHRNRTGSIRFGETHGLTYSRVREGTQLATRSGLGSEERDLRQNLGPKSRDTPLDKADRTQQTRSKAQPYRCSHAIEYSEVTDEQF